MFDILSTGGDAAYGRDGRSCSGPSPPGARRRRRTGIGCRPVAVRPAAPAGPHRRAVGARRHAPEQGRDRGRRRGPAARRLLPPRAPDRLRVHPRPLRPRRARRRGHGLRGAAAPGRPDPPRRRPLPAHADRDRPHRRERRVLRRDRRREGHAAPPRRGRHPDRPARLPRRRGRRGQRRRRPRPGGDLRGHRAQHERRLRRPRRAAAAHDGRDRRHRLPRRRVAGRTHRLRGPRRRHERPAPGPDDRGGGAAGARGRRWRSTPRCPRPTAGRRWATSVSATCCSGPDGRPTAHRRHHRGDARPALLRGAVLRRAVLVADAAAPVATVDAAGRRAVRTTWELARTSCGAPTGSPTTSSTPRSPRSCTPCAARAHRARCPCTPGTAVHTAAVCTVPSRCARRPPSPRRRPRWSSTCARCRACPVRCVEVDAADHLYLAGRSMVPDAQLHARAGLRPVLLGQARHDQCRLLAGDEQVRDRHAAALGRGADPAGRHARRPDERRRLDAHGPPDERDQRGADLHRRLAEPHADGDPREGAPAQAAQRPQARDPRLPAAHDLGPQGRVAPAGGQRVLPADQAPGQGARGSGGGDQPAEPRPGTAHRQAADDLGPARVRLRHRGHPAAACRHRCRGDDRRAARLRASAACACGRWTSGCGWWPARSPTCSRAVSRRCSASAWPPAARSRPPRTTRSSPSTAGARSAISPSATGSRHPAVSRPPSEPVPMPEERIVLLAHLIGDGSFVKRAAAPLREHGRGEPRGGRCGGRGRRSASPRSATTTRRPDARACASRRRTGSLAAGGTRSRSGSTSWGCSGCAATRSSCPRRCSPCRTSRWRCSCGTCGRRTAACGGTSATIGPDLLRLDEPSPGRRRRPAAAALRCAQPAQAGPQGGLPRQLAPTHQRRRVPACVLG